ncbi:MAG: monovalent cation/H+ antiporter complex subunit F [Oscillospiraceae bacterium]|nr:monovalent cation/H+ antiporter complex subunit F [Oscillospiraceae bacterium]
MGIIGIAVWVIIGFLGLCGVLVVRGPSNWDRLLGLSLITAKIVLLIALFASLHNIAYMLDIALMYALLGFIGTMFIARFFMARAKRAPKEADTLCNSGNGADGAPIGKRGKE